MSLWTLLDELVCAWRGLARAPGFTALAVAVLSLGLGATVFMYGVIDALLLRQPPYPAAERIYAVHGRLAASGTTSDSIELKDYLAIRESGLQAEAIAAVYPGTVYLTGDGPATRLEGGFASASLFDVAGVEPALGRRLLPQDEPPAGAAVAVLGDALWRERFDADPSVVGRRLRLNGRDTEVIGVMPPDFSFPIRQQLWLPSRQDAQTAAERDTVKVMVYVRLSPGASLDAAQQTLATVAAGRIAADPKTDFRGFELVTLGAGWVGETGRKLLWTLFAAVGLVLLIACANVSNLLLSRAAWRMRETSVRAALGASRGRLVLHLLAESALISASAAATGLLLAALGLDAIKAAFGILHETPPPWIEPRVSGPVALIALASALGTMLLAGVPAALRATRPSLDAMLRDGGRSGQGPAIGRIAWSLVVVEVALAAAVVGGAALMTRSVLLVTQTDLGVDTAQLMTARVGLPQGSRETPEEQAAFFARYVERLEAQPGVHAAGLMAALPGHGSGRVKLIAEVAPGAALAAARDADSLPMSPSAFRALRLEPLAGRLFDERDDAGAEPVVVVNESLARLLWPDSQAVGQRARAEGPDDVWRTVVGVVPDIVHDIERAKAAPMAYLPIAQMPPRFVSVVARGDGEPRALLPAMRRALEETDPDLALYWERTLDESLALRTGGYRLIGTLFFAFGAIALVLAAAGLFGVLSFHVGQRIRELGLRRALGASNGRILTMLARTTGLQLAVGLALGFAALPALERLLDRMLLEIDPGSVWVYVAVLLIMLAVAAAAVAQPTRRALRVDPAAALRYE